MHKKLAKQGLAIYSVILDDPKDAATRAGGKRYLDKIKPPFPVVYLDNRKEWKEKLNISSFPRVFVFNQNNKYVLNLPEDMEDVNYEKIDKAVELLLKK